MQTASIAALVGLVVHYAIARMLGWPLITDAIAEWIMARTPNTYSVWLLEHLGAWAKPFAATGGLAALGGVLWLVGSFRNLWVRVAGAAAAALATGFASFWAPAGLVLAMPPIRRLSASRRAFLMMAGTAVVAAEARWREARLEDAAARPKELTRFAPPEPDPRFAHVRTVVTPVNQFYGMSKNTVDPAPDAGKWRLRVMAEDKRLAEFGYADLISMPATERYVTLRCVSNTLRSNLMGNAHWRGVRVSQLMQAPGEEFVEAVVMGEDGHSDSYPISYLFGEESLLALGMNGKTLDRTHGFPLRLLVPRYYGFKNVKWISEIRFVRKPYLGTWPKMGYTKEALVNTCSTIDRVTPCPDGLLAGGVAFAGSRGIRAVTVRADGGQWMAAELERPLSPYAWTRWRAVIPVRQANRIEVRAQDGTGAWQAEKETPLFPGGVAGPTIYSSQPR